MTDTHPFEKNLNGNCMVCGSFDDHHIHHVEAQMWCPFCPWPYPRAFHCPLPRKDEE